MIPEGTDAATITPATAAEVLRHVLNYKREKGLTVKQLARGVGVAEGTMSPVLAGKYPGNSNQIILDLDRWLEDQRKIDSAPKPASFVWTSVARSIETIASATVKLKTIGLIYGPETSGLGKTTALQAIAAERSGCILVTIDKVKANVTGVLGRICEQLRISDGPNNAMVYDRICSLLTGTSRLLIIDQIHNLCGSKKDLPFHVLAELHEKTKSPQLWAGTSDVVGYLKRGQIKGQEPLSQVRSRIGICRDLTQPLRAAGPGPGSAGDGQLYTIDEIRAIFGRNKMRLAADAARYLLRLANLPDSGALRTCKNLVIMATTLYEDRHEVLTEEMLRSAHRMLVTDESYNLLQMEIEQGGGGPRMAKVG